MAIVCVVVFGWVWRCLYYQHYELERSQVTQLKQIQYFQHLGEIKRKIESVLDSDTLYSVVVQHRESILIECTVYHSFNSRLSQLFVFFKQNGLQIIRLDIQRSGDAGSFKLHVSP